MRKTLIAAAVVAAGAFVYYKLTAANDVAIPELDYVPADTMLFSGQFKPVDMADYLSSMGFGPQYYANPEFEQVLQELAGSADSSPEARFLVSLLRNYLDVLTPGQDFSAKSGFKAKMRTLIYMVGLSPVSRMEVADADAFFGMFDRAEQDSGFSHQQVNSADVSYRRYRFQKDDISIDLLVTVKEGWATLALTSDKLASANVSELLAVTKPAKSLNTENTLGRIAAKYNLSRDALGFVSFTELARTLTTTDGNRLARDLNGLFAAELEPVLAAWRTKDCQQDVGSIAANWPGVFFDSELDYSTPGRTHIVSDMLLASENKPVLTALSSLRGYLPPHLQHNDLSSMFHVGLGIDPVQLSAAVGKVWSNMTEPAYSCQPLAELQQNLKQSNPVAMLAMAGMANGVQGMSVTVNGLTLDAANMMPTEADALVTLSVANVRSFIEGLAVLTPALAGVQLPATGVEVDITDIVPDAAMFGVAAKLKLSDDHLLLYSGAKAKQQADAVANSKLAKNGLFSMGLDYAAFFNTLIKTMESSGAEVPENIRGLQDMNMKLALTVDITEQGILTNTKMELAAPAK